MDDRIETPAFVVDESLLTRQVDSFRDALDRGWPGAVLSYSVKTNSLPWLVAWMGRNGVPAEVVSEEEWQLALRVGHDPAEVIVNGPVKTPELLTQAFDAGAMVNLDSRRELRWVAERAAAGKRVDSVGLRVNWDVNRDAPDHTASGSAGLRFGFHADNGDLDSAIAEMRAAGVRIAGLHLHVTSLTRALDTYVSAGHTARRIIAEHGLELDWIDLGGGFFGGDSDRFPTPDQYVTAIRDALGDAVDPARPWSRCPSSCTPASSTPSRYKTTSSSSPTGRAPTSTRSCVNRPTSTPSTATANRAPLRRSSPGSPASTTTGS